MEKTTQGPIEKVLYEVGKDKLARQKADADFKEQKRNKDAEKMARMSNAIFSMQEMLKEYGKLLPGQVLMVDKDGNLFRGRVNTEKMQPIGGKLPKRISHSLDTADFTHEEMHTTSFAKPAMVFGFKVQWNSVVKLAQKIDHPITQLFLEKLEGILEQDWSAMVSYEITQGPLKNSYIKIKIKDYPVEVIFNQWGNSRMYVFKGKTYEIMAKGRDKEIS